MAIAALLLVGCGSSQNPVADRHPAKPTTTTTTLSADHTAVLAAWRHYWDVYIAVGEQMQLPDPRLAQVATGQELQTLGGAFLADQSEGHVLKGSIDLDPKVVRIQGDSATISDCYFSHILVYDSASGQAIGPGATNRSLVAATLVLDNGMWKVSAITHQGDGCVAP